jgi:hypothetical protein
MKKISSYKLTPFFLAIFFSLSIVSCKKGDPGTPGQNGTDGNANVKVDTFTLHNADWGNRTSEFYDLVVGENAGSTTTQTLNPRYHDRSFSAITNDIIHHGAVLVFFNSSHDIDGADEWTQLNFYFSIEAFTYNYVFQAFPGRVRLNIFFTPVDGPSTPDPAVYIIPDYKFKILAVEGNVAGNSLIGKNGIAYAIADLKSMSYDQVSEVLNIKNQD